MKEIFFSLLLLIIFLNSCEENANNNENELKTIL